MHQRKPTPSRNMLSASLSVALGISLASAAGAAATGHDAHAVGQDDATSLPMPTIIDPDRLMLAGPLNDRLDLDIDYDLSNSPIAHGLLSGDLDQNAQRNLLDQLRAEDEPQSGDATLAATLIVTNCNDSGYGSLRDAVDQADGGDIIDMSALSCSEITLADNIAIWQNDLTLRGKLIWDNTNNKYTPSPTITPESSNTSGLFRHLGTGTLQLEALRLQQGKQHNSAPGHGGCVSSWGDLALVETEAKYCTAESNQSGKEVRGGALHALGDVTLTRSQVHGSKVISAVTAAGGGIWAGGRLRMTDSRLYNNSAASTGGWSGAGGGAYVLGGATLRRVEIDQNKASVIGGMMINDERDEGADIYIKHALVHNNRSTGTGNAGGMALNTGGNISLKNNTFTNNKTARDTGAGVRIFNGTVTMESNLISGNFWVPDPSDPETRYVADFWSDVATSGSHNLVGHAEWSGSHPPPNDTIRQFNSPLYDSRPTTGSWAFNRGKFLSDILGWIPPPPGCTPGPGCLNLPIFEPSIDQAGGPRTIGAGTDIGALESDALFVDGFNHPPRFDL